MGKRQVAAMQTRLKVIAAAEKLIAERGFESVTVDDIAAEAGVAKGTFYTYFKRKEDVVWEIAGPNFASLQERAKASDGDVVEKLDAYLTESMKLIVETGLKIAQQWIKTVVDPSDPDGKGKLIYDLGVIREFLELAVESGELTDDTPVDQLHQWIAAEYYGIVLNWCILDGAIDPTELLSDYCKVQLSHSLACYKKS